MTMYAPNLLIIINLYVSHVDEYYKTETLNLLRQNPVELTPQLVDLQTMQNCVKNLKNNKAAGYDGICSERFKYAGLDLLVHMCLLFNTMLCHSFVPSDFFVMV